MTIQEARYHLLHQLKKIYDSREAGNITDWVLENITGRTRMERVIHKDLIMDTEQQSRLDSITHDLLSYKPIQYILNECWFFKRRFYVNEAVLIPRPETEELVEWIIDDYRKHNPATLPQLLDIGTGSGNIAITLSLELQLHITAIDHSVAALEVAKKNAAALGGKVNFVQCDFTDPGNWPSLPAPDIIVSNPPYIPLQEQEQMAGNVLKFEPHSALFVPDDDPLLFYRLIADFAATYLRPGGKIYVEISEYRGESTESLFRHYGYETELKKDMQGRHRLIKAWKKVGENLQAPELLGC